MRQTKKKVDVIDIAPSWCEVIETYLDVLVDSKSTLFQRELCRVEIRRMATVLDQFIIDEKESIERAMERNISDTAAKQAGYI